MYFDGNTQDAIFRSIEKHGQKLSVQLFELKSKLIKMGVKVNMAFQISCESNQKEEVFVLLYETLRGVYLQQCDREIVIEKLVKLNYRKKEVCQLIINEIYSGQCENCWALCDYLYELNQKEFSKDYIKIASKSELGVDRQMIFLLMGKQKNSMYLETLINNLNDYDINGHVLSALNNFKDNSLNFYFESFLNDPRKWVRDIATKRLKN